MAVTVKKIDNKKNLYRVTFSYQPLIAGKLNVYLSGDFNQFQYKSNPLIEHNGLYSLTTELPAGKYSYKFIVDDLWLHDQDATEFEADGFGGFNSILYVGKAEDILALHLIKFKYPSDLGDKKVYITGNFNEWQPQRDLMRYNRVTKQHEIIVPLKVGTYHYKFFVQDNWIHDETNPHQEADGLGGINSIISVNPDDTVYSSKYPDFIDFGLISTKASFYLNQKSEKDFEIRIKVYQDNCDSLTLFLNNNEYQLVKQDTNHYFDYYVHQFTSESTKFSFYFKLDKGDRSAFICPGYLTHYQEEILPFLYDKHEHTPFLTPQWVKDGIFYQIFVDRFYNGDPNLNQDFSEEYYRGKNQPPEPGSYLKEGEEYFHFVKNWYDHTGLGQSPYLNSGKPDTNSFYGGDFAGIIEKMDYLTDLGVTILYLNPVFESPSNHKYDAADYMKPDPHFGSEETFRALVDIAHNKGIKLILDVAFNHTGDAFFAFLDAKQKGPDSEFFHWYEWKQWPLPENQVYNPSDYYNCWWGFGHMPDLDFDKSRLSPYENGVTKIEDADPNWDVIHYIYDVVDYWIGKMDIDVFRLDVPNEVPFWFWRLFRDKVKSLKSDAYLVGEIWHDARDWIGENAFDAVMNYAGFKDPVMQFFNLRTCNAREFDKYLKAGLMLNPPQANQVMMNLLDGHDTHRFLEIAQGDVNRLKLAVLFQMTFVGVPHIWYGDEIGMVGAHDPDCRRPFNWQYKKSKSAMELRDFYKQLINIRKEYNALRSENFKTIIAHQNLIAYQRWDWNQSLWIVINNNNEAIEINLPVETDNRSLTDILSREAIEISGGFASVTIPPYSGKILV